MRARVLKEAEAELHEAMLWYEDRKDGLGLEFYESVTETMIAIGESPLRFPLYEAAKTRYEYHRAPVPRFPYIVVYESRADEILIVAVAHTSQQPGYWESR